MGKSSTCPGFRFKPTDDVLVMHYLKRKLLGKKLDPEVIAEINIYDFSPQDLPDKSILSGDKEWYFFCPISKKYSSGPRTNRATETGYWKSSGMDREVKYKGKTIAMIKTLIFHEGKSPKGTRTNWVMHEYRMNDEDLANQGVAQEAYVICNIFEKSGHGPKNGEQYGAPFEEEDWDDEDNGSTLTFSVTVGLLVNPDNVSFSNMINSASNEPGPSTIRSSECTDVPTNDDGMLTPRDIALMFSNNDTQEVEDRIGNNVMTVLPNEEYVNVEQLLDDLDKFVADDSLDTFLCDEDFWKDLEE